ncbi:MAG TPA: ferritin-like domain-containing protein [Rhodothermales bacterium]
MQESAKEALIAGLNEDLAHEYQAVIMYATYASMVTGMHRPTLKAFFETEISEELAHAQLLAEKITALGGKPTTRPAEVVYHGTPREMLEEVRKAEAETIQRYVQRRRQAEDFGDLGLAVDLDDIIRDETGHKEETEKLLRGMEN